MIGKTLVHYEITAEIGKGGMGEVYQAKDTKLGRDVAIKVLPEEFALDTDRVARFQREAKLLASLNHPNIAAIYGLEESEGTHFLVMELIEGDTLSDRIKTGPIPVEEALKLALQMAEALEAAHEKGVIHRDLKPANIKVTPEGKVKILDFGLAKAYAGDQENLSPMDSPTISAAATQQGVILGTAAYMSPEQAKGIPVNTRADIWAFGVVLFEMLTGRQSFTGETASETLASVMKSEPEWDWLPPNLHSRIRLLLERCLEKQPKNRYSGISDARVDIQKALIDPSGVITKLIPIAESQKNSRQTLLWASIAVILIIIAATVIWNIRTPEPPKVMRFSYELPENQQFTSNIQLAVSPDGSQFVYSTTDGLYLRSVDALDARLVSGTDQNSMQAVFSPDGKWIGYWSSNDRKLKKIAINGGVPVVLCDTGAFVAGLSWNPDNTIVYSDLMTDGGIKRVSTDGGTPESLIKAKVANMGTEGIPVNPQMLPDGKTILFTNMFSPTDRSRNQIIIQSLESGERKTLVGGFAAMYLSTGHLVYGQVNDNITSIVAVPFDLDTLEVKGGPVPLLEGVGGRAFSVSGTLVYVPGTSGIGLASLRTLVWVGREGKEEQIETEPSMYRFPKVSPDGTKVALTVSRSGNQDIWIWDLLRETQTRLTFHENNDLQAIWSPDSKWIVFWSDRDGGGVYQKSADGTGKAELVISSPETSLFPSSWLAEGDRLVFGTQSGNSWDIAMLSMSGDKNLQHLLQEETSEIEPVISPDGKWMAYASNESGRLDIYVRPFPDMDAGKWQVSTNGGVSPLWSPDGNELFYIVEGSFMVVSLEKEPAFQPGKPDVLFNGMYISGAGEGIPWDIDPNGKRFLMMKRAGAASDESTTEAPRKINIVLNWVEELKQRVPVE